MIILSTTEMRNQKGVTFSNHPRNAALGNSRASSERGCRNVPLFAYSLCYAGSKRHRKRGKPMHIQGITLAHAYFSPKVRVYMLSHPLHPVFCSRHLPKRSISRMPGPSHLTYRNIRAYQSNYLDPILN